MGALADTTVITSGRAPMQVGKGPQNTVIDPRKLHPAELPAHTACACIVGLSALLQAAFSLVRKTHHRQADHDKQRAARRKGNGRTYLGYTHPEWQTLWFIDLCGLQVT